MAGGVYPVICSRLYLSAYGKDHYEILHWWICLLENVLDSANVRDFSLCGSVCTAGKKKTIQAVCASLLMALIIVTGKNPYVGGQAIYQKAVNMQKLPADVCQISNLIADTRAEGETALAVMPEDLVGYVRQYDASIRLLYGRRSKSEKPVRKIRRQMRKEQPKIKKLIRRIRQQGVNYLVFLADEQQDAKIQRNGFEKIGKVGGYSVYKDKW